MWYDLLTLVILMYAMFRGAMKGVVWQLATIAALLLCFFFAGSLSTAVSPFIRVEPPLNMWIAMLLLYLVFSFLSFGVARMVHEMVEQMRIEALDRHLGAILGLVKGGMFSVFLTFFLLTLSHTAREPIIASESGYVAAVVIDRLAPVIPGNLHALLEPYLRRLDTREIEREHLDERYARQRDRRAEDDPFTGDDRADDRDDLVDARDRDARPGIDDRRVDDRRIDDRRLEDDRRAKDDGRLNDDRRVRDDRRPDDDRRLDGDRRDPVGRRDIALDRSRDVRGSSFDDPAPGGPVLNPPTPGRRSDATDDFGDADRPDRRRDPRRDEARRDDDRINLAGRDDRGDDLGAPAPDESDWLSSLPAIVTGELKQLARRVWRKTRPEHRGELSRRLSSASLPDVARKTLREWQNGRPTDGGDGSNERASLEREIVRLIPAAGSDRRLVVEDIEGSLTGIPDAVSINVLRDWRDDLRDTKSDPRESDASSLGRRIRRELSRAGISVRTLDSATQERLRRSEVR